MRSIFIVYLAFAGFTLALSTGAAADDFEDKRRALQTIRDTAADICSTIEHEGSSSATELSGDVKGKLNAVISKLAELGIDTAGSYSSKEYKNVLQSELATAIQNNANCRLEVLKILEKKLLSPTAAPHQTNKPSESEALRQIMKYNEIQVYHIQKVYYVNGYRIDSDNYMVASSVEVKILVPCRHFSDVMDYFAQSKFGDKDKGQKMIATIAVGLASFKLVGMFGGNCNVGDIYTLSYEDKFLKTEKGWVLVDQN